MLINPTFSESPLLYALLIYVITYAFMIYFSRETSREIIKIHS